MGLVDTLRLARLVFFAEVSAQAQHCKDAFASAADLKRALRGLPRRGRSESEWPGPSRMS